MLYYKYIISPKVACDGCTDYYLMYLNVKKSDNSYDLGLNLDIIDYRTFNFRHQRIAIFNFKPYKFNDEINVNYKINSGNRFFLNSENDKQDAHTDMCICVLLYCYFLLVRVQPVPNNSYNKFLVYYMVMTIYDIIIIQSYLFIFFMILHSQYP